MKVTSQEVYKRIKSAMLARRCPLVYKDEGKEGARLANFSYWLFCPSSSCRNHHVNGEVVMAPSQLIAPFVYQGVSKHQTLECVLVTFVLF